MIASEGQASALSGQHTATSQAHGSPSFETSLDPSRWPSAPQHSRSAVDHIATLWTPLHIAADKGDKHTIESLLSRPHANPDQLVSSSCDGGYLDTPLSIAIRSESVKAVECLLHAGANVHATMVQRGQQTTPLRLSMDWLWSFPIKRLMLQHVRNHDLGLQGAPLLPLWRATSCVQTMELLLHFRADLHGSSPCGDTALHNACFEGDLDATRFLLQRGADIEAWGSNEETPLHRCTSQFASVQCMRLLLAGGADIEASNIDGATALHCACEWGKLDYVTSLLHHGADANARNEKNESPLHCLAYTIRKTSFVETRSLVRTLMEYVADINALDRGRTPLLGMVHRNVNSDDCFHAELTPGMLAHDTRVFIEEGASLNIIDHVDKTVLDYVLEAMILPHSRKAHKSYQEAFPDLICYLLMKGAKSGKQIRSEGRRDRDLVDTV